MLVHHILINSSIFEGYKCATNGFFPVSLKQCSSVYILCSEGTAYEKVIDFMIDEFSY